MTTDSTRRYLGSWAGHSDIIEAVAWFDLQGCCRVLVADFAGGRRVIVRQFMYSSKIQWSRWDGDAPEGCAQGDSGRQS
jgi:hypothetical protein